MFSLIQFLLEVKCKLNKITQNSGWSIAHGICFLSFYSIANVSKQRGMLVVMQQK